MIASSEELIVRLAVMNVDHQDFENKDNMMNYVCQGSKSKTYMIMIDYQIEQLW